MSELSEIISEIGGQVAYLMLDNEKLEARIVLLEQQHEYSGTQACLDRIELLEKVLAAAIRVNQFPISSTQYLALNDAIADCETK